MGRIPSALDDLIDYHRIVIDDLPALAGNKLHEFFNTHEDGSIDNILNLLTQPSDFEVNQAINYATELKMIEKLKRADLITRINFLSSIIEEEELKNILIISIKKYYNKTYGESFIIPDNLTFEEKLCFVAEPNKALKLKEFFNNLPSKKLAYLLRYSCWAQLPDWQDSTHIIFNALQKLELFSQMKYILNLLNDGNKHSFRKYLETTLHFQPIQEKRHLNIKYLGPNIYQLFTNDDMIAVWVHAVLTQRRINKKLKCIISS